MLIPDRGSPGDELTSRTSTRSGRFASEAWCPATLVLLLLFGFFAHLRYLTHNCPVDLSGDEAQYWDWSRQIGWSYYSKGPLVAWIIRASCAAFGRDSMVAVRFPALLLSAGVSILTYCLTRKLFGSPRLALGAVLINHIVPMFAGGSVLMTIDPPFFFCWALATYLAATAVFDQRPRVWPLVGVAAGIGFLAKYTMFLWFAPVLLFLATESRYRSKLRTVWPWSAVAVGLLFTAPVLLWNANHHWVSVRHVAVQTGAEDGKFSPLGTLEFVGGQLGIVGPGLAVIIAASVFRAFRNPTRTFSFPAAGGFAADSPATLSPVTSNPEPRPDTPPPSSPSPLLQIELNSPQTRFLAWIGVSLLLLTLLAGLRTKAQLNWPAPAYFTLTILAAHFLATCRRDRKRWRLWRLWFYPTIAFGLLAIPLVHDPQKLYPAARWLNRRTEVARAHKLDPRLPRPAMFDGLLAKLLPSRGLDGRNVDFTAKLKGWQELGKVVSDERDRLGPGAFVLCSDYQETAEMAFYVRGQPATYYLGSYFRQRPKRLTQYDFWPNRTLEPTAVPGDSPSHTNPNPLLGRNAIFIGQFDFAPPELFESFEKVYDPANDGTAAATAAVAKRATPLEVWRDDLRVQSFRLIRCYGFRGLRRPAGQSAY